MKSAATPILVTGAHRSGSTWTGRVLSQASNVRFVQEPFNIEKAPKHCPLTYWFEHIENEYNVQEPVKEYLRSFLQPSFSRGVYEMVRWQETKEIKCYLQEMLDKPISYRTLYKDPIAVMSAEWIASELEADVVAVIRHPAAFVASIKLKNWEFDFHEIWKQQDFVEKNLSPFKEQIRLHSTFRYDIISQGILLWNLIYYMVYTYREKYAEKWYFIRHEDLSKEPLCEFEKIFAFLGLDFTESIQQYIRKSTDGSKINGINRNSKENLHTWKTRLSAEEVLRIKEGTEEIANHFYSPKDWE